MFLGRLAISSAQMNPMVSSGVLEKKTESCNANTILVDICITTDFKAMEGVCILADLLAKSKLDDSESIGHN
jgi:hypothetical protein